MHCPACGEAVQIALDITGGRLTIGLVLAGGVTPHERRQQWHDVVDAALRDEAKAPHEAGT